MGRGELYDDGFRPQFSGHETFPLRYGWLKKAFDVVCATQSADSNNKSVFGGEDAIAKFGVGKNMVSAMRYWATAARIIRDVSNSNKGPYVTTDLGNFLLSDQGVDPFLEHSASLWLLHWQLAGHARPVTTCFYVFNYYDHGLLLREQLVAALSRYCVDRGFTDVADYTLKRDVECFIRTYAPRSGRSEEESLESPMAELELIQPIGKRDGYGLSSSPKPTLPDEVFFFALAEYTQKRAPQSSFSVETITHDPGSPGRVFLLDEQSVVARLSRAEEVTNTRLSWSESAGLRQIFVLTPFDEAARMELLRSAYGRAPLQRIA